MELISREAHSSAGSTVEGEEMIEAVTAALLDESPHPEFVTLMVERVGPQRVPAGRGFREALSDWIDVPTSDSGIEIDEVDRARGHAGLHWSRQIATTQHSGVEVETPSAAVWWFEDGPSARRPSTSTAGRRLKAAGIDPDRPSGD